MKNDLLLVRRAKRKQDRQETAVMINARQEWAKYRGIDYKRSIKDIEACPHCGKKLQIKPKTEYKYRGQSYAA
jgi:DNA-directed RNA polymerase subunit RPC12/RpoP